MTQNIINHVCMVLDRSLSMTPHAQNLIKAADAQIAHLAQRSKELDQETRITIYTFDDHVECLVWDKDVLRQPSIASLYRVGGNTAFIDASLLALRDLAMTPEKYGDHSFLIYVLSDGQENRSKESPFTLKQHIDKLPDHWTVAALVPNASAKFEAKKFGFPAGNIEIWDVSSRTGATEVGDRIRVATDNYMTARAAGVRSTTNLFTMTSTTLNASTIVQAGLTPLPRDKYMLVPVPNVTVIKDFAESCGQHYRTGNGYYELSKRERIQPNKKIAIVERGGGNNVYIGGDARQLLGLPDHETLVGPEYNADYKVHVQSTSNNRKLMPGTKFLYLL
jgi:hypothetical protein